MTTPHTCTAGWIEVVPFSGDMLHTLTTTQFQGYQARCNGGWIGPMRNYEVQAQHDVYGHNGALAGLPSETRQPFFPKKVWAGLFALALTMAAIALASLTSSNGLKESSGPEGPKWGEVCSTGRERYYRAHGYTCYRDTDGVYRLLANTP